MTDDFNMTIPPGLDLSIMLSAEAVLVALYLAGGRSLTVQEITDRIKKADCTVRNRISEHEDQGLVFCDASDGAKDIGPYRWRLTDDGRAEARKAILEEMERLPERQKAARERTEALKAIIEPYVEDRIRQAFAEFGLDYIAMRNSGKQPTGEPKNERR